MGSGSFLLAAIFFSISTFFLYNLQCSSSPRDLKGRGEGLGNVLVANHVGSEYGSPTQGWQEVHVEKVAGGDHVDGGIQIRALERFRILLGLHEGLGSRIADTSFATYAASPSPAPAPAPIPYPNAVHVHAHPPFPGPGLIPLLQGAQVVGNVKKGKARRVVLAVALSTGTAFAIFLLTTALLCRRYRRCQAKRLEKMVHASGISGGSEAPTRASKYSSAHALTSRPANRLFFVNSNVVIHEKGSRGARNVASQENQLYSSSSIGESIQCGCGMDDGSFTCREACNDDPASLEDVSSAARSSDASNTDIHVIEKILSPSGLPVRSVLTGSTLQVQGLRKETLSPHGSSTCSNLNTSSSPQPPLSRVSPNRPPSPTLSHAQSTPRFKFSRPPPPLPPLPPMTVHPPPPPPPPLPTFLPPPRPPPPPTIIRKHANSLRSSLSPSQPQPIMDMDSIKCSSSRPPPAQLLQPPQKTSPLPKLKPLHWDKVKAAPNQAMVWNKIRSSSFELDEEMMESLFGYNTQISTKKEESVSSSKNSYQSKHVLEPQRLRNFTILLKALNATVSQVCDALSRGSGLSAQQLEVLTKMVPTKEEELKLLKYNGDINELDPAERFLASILRIPCSFLKAEAMLYAETFEDELSQIRESFDMLEEACKELRSSRLFLKLLEAVLRTGNRMNAGTMRGGASAFKLDALLKLADVKGTDGKTTLLNFIVKEVIRSERASSNGVDTETEKGNQTEEDIKDAGQKLVATLNVELCNVKKAAGFDFTNLAASISNLSDGMGKLKHLISGKLLIEEGNESFAHIVNDFRVKCERKIEKLKDDEKQILQKVRDTTEYFHGDMSRDEIDQLCIFVIVRDFLGMLEQTCKEIGTSKKSLSPNCPSKRILF